MERRRATAGRVGSALTLVDSLPSAASAHEAFYSQMPLRRRGAAPADGEASASSRELPESRECIQAAAEAERQRIEHALHDGAQQRLTAVRISLTLAAERVEALDSEVAEDLRGLGIQIEEAIEEIRSLARGIYPQPLSQGGLVEALRAVVARSPLPTTLRHSGVRRYAPEIEAAVYFVCVEALQNVAKHARNASAVVVELSDDGRLRLEVRDDGDGFDLASMALGVGLPSIRDRVASVGGNVTIESTPSRGTRNLASISGAKATPSRPRSCDGHTAASASTQAARETAPPSPSRVRLMFTRSG